MITARACEPDPDAEANQGLKGFAGRAHFFGSKWILIRYSKTTGELERFGELQWCPIRALSSLRVMALLDLVPKHAQDGADRVR